MAHSPTLLHKFGVSVTANEVNQQVIFYFIYFLPKIFIFKVYVANRNCTHLLCGHATIRVGTYPPLPAHRRLCGESTEESP